MKQYSDLTLSVILFLCSATWGLYWIPLRAIESHGVSSSWSVVILNACPLLALLPASAIKFKSRTYDLLPTLCAALMIGLAFSFYANSLLETSVVRATLLFYLTPIWSTIISVIWLKEKLTRARVVSIIIAIIGLSFLVISSSKSNVPLNVGDFFGFLSGICWAVGGSALKKWPKTPILPLTTFVFLLTTGVSILFAWFFYRHSIPDLELIGRVFPASLIWSTVIMLPPFILVFKISTILFPGRVGILMMAEVMVAIISGSLMLPEERISSLQWVGAVCIVLAALVEILFGYQRRLSNISLRK